MIPDLGKYAIEVLSAYGVTILLLGGITGLSWQRWRRLKAEVERVERGRDG
ncbi:heme exporter protein CcmD [Rubellimicrobium rubrum]|uniref:Heme exporter protein D n=1 Tax=Rubellimicrobium rubrum TaxID=2585369 RepID=A0A5C4N2B2_9RHOB|nr:heme exporter protein CcmD [Rubellimicrobium rubrum]TNC52837.1 heme exporter protein CcmD [Rubellimicrobium rubrum]